MTSPPAFGRHARPRLDPTPHLAWILNAKRQVEWANGELREYTGQPDRALLADFVHREDHPRVLAMLDAQAERRVGARLRGANGEYALFDVQSSVLTAEPSERTWLCTAVARDDQPPAALLHTLLDISADCVKLLDLDARLLSMNDGGRQVMEVDDFDVCRNLLWPDFWRGDDRRKVEAALDQARAGQRVSFDGAAVTMKGTPKWWEVTVAPVFDEQGNVQQLVAVSRDITDRKAGQLELTALSANLEDRVAERTLELEEERAALDAFVAYTEAVGAETDVPTLAALAASTVRASHRHLSVAYCEADGQMWKARAWSADVPNELVEQLRTGLRMDGGRFERMARTRQAVFVDGWDATANHVENSGAYGAVAFVPLVVQGEVQGLLAVGTRMSRAWTERERSLVRAVGRGLNVALERAAHTRVLRETNAQLHEHSQELELRTRALEAFEKLSRDLTLETDPLVLIREAQRIVLSLLPGGIATYHEPEEGAWRLLVQSGDPHGEAVERALAAGLADVTGGRAYVPTGARHVRYRETRVPERDGQGGGDTWIVASAVLPVLVSGELHGVFGVGRLERHAGWSDVTRGVLETVARSLGLALERAASLAALTDERRKLSAANEELEAFAYSASHDLRTPVRHVLGYVGLLRRTLGESVSDRSRHYLDVIETSAARMNTLIDAMLELSRTSRLPLRVRPVDLSALVRQVLAELAPDTGHRRVRWQVQPLPVVQADEDTLRQVLHNLLGNALKYTGPRDEAVIEVWAEERETDVAVYVRDNGVGFDERYAQRLFGVFQRLHRDEQFEGVGVGLATVRRIVQRHGGEVVATGRPEQGAQFGFTLPKPVVR